MPVLTPLASFALPMGLVLGRCVTAPLDPLAATVPFAARPAGIEATGTTVSTWRTTTGVDNSVAAIALTMVAVLVFVRDLVIAGARAAGPRG